MENKTFELLEKMFAEFSEFRKESGQRFDNIENRLDRAEGHVTQVDNRLGKVEGHLTRIEIEHGKKLDALLDIKNRIFEKLQDHDKRFDDIDTKLNKLTDQVIIHDSKF